MPVHTALWSAQWQLFPGEGTQGCPQQILFNNESFTCRTTVTYESWAGSPMVSYTFVRQMLTQRVIFCEANLYAPYHPGVMLRLRACVVRSCMLGNLLVSTMGKPDAL